MPSFLLDAAFLGLCAGGLRWPWAWSLAAALAWLLAASHPPRLRGALPLLWAAWLLWTGVSAAVSPEPLLSLAAFARSSLPALLFLSAAGRFTEEDREGLFRRLASAVLLVGALGGLLVLTGFSGTGLYSHVNYTAALFAALFAASLQARGREEGSKRSVLASWLAALALAGVLLLRSRAALWACVFAAAVGMWRRGLRKSVLALGVVVPAALALVPEGALKLDHPGAWVRPRIWSAALEVARESPFLGEGPGLFERGFLRHQVAAPAGYATRFALSSAHAHSELLQSAAETGFAGAALLLLALGASFTLAWRRAPPSWTAEAALAAASALAAQALVDNVLALPALGWVAALALAAACPELPESGRRPTGAWRAFCAAGCALSLFAWWPAWALARRPPMEALRLAPGDPSLWEGLARERARFSSPDLAGALAAMREASRLAPSNAVYRLALAELSGLRGDWAESAVQARTAAGLEPSSPQARLLLAEALCRLGRRSESQAAFADAARLARTAPRPDTAYDRVVLGSRRVSGDCP